MKREAALIALTIPSLGVLTIVWRTDERPDHRVC